MPFTGAYEGGKAQVLLSLIRSVFVATPILHQSFLVSMNMLEISLPFPNPHVIVNLRAEAHDMLTSRLEKIFEVPVSMLGLTEFCLLCCRP